MDTAYIKPQPDYELLGNPTLNDKAEIRVLPRRLYIVIYPCGCGRTFEKPSNRNGLEETAINACAISCKTLSYDRGYRRLLHRCEIDAAERGWINRLPVAARSVAYNALMEEIQNADK